VTGRHQRSVRATARGATLASSHRVIVVGAGLAGLHAAWRLRTSGIDVRVLEARERVGGRTWSATLRGGVVVERGGEFIAPTDRCLRTLCDQLGLELIPHGFSFDQRTAQGQTPPTEDELAAFDAAARAQLADRGGEDELADGVLPASRRRTPLQASIIRRIETSLTVPLTEVSAARLFSGGNHRYDPAVRVRGGNDRIARELARRLGDRILLQTPVTAVDHSTRHVSVEMADGASLTASVAVLALPLPLLLALELRPGLPQSILAAADRLAFGDAAKLHVPLSAAATAGGVASGDERWWCWVSAAASATSGAPVLSAFAGGAAVVAALDIETGAGRWSDAALRLRPDVRAAGDPLITHWGAQTWTRGSYSAPRVGITSDDDRAWASSHGTLVFAGEHAAGLAAGTMNGAALSGARAARVVAELIDS
jgi:monoamine oxidase